MGRSNISLAMRRQRDYVTMGIVETFHDLIVSSPADYVPLDNTQNDNGVIITPPTADIGYFSATSRIAETWALLNGRRHAFSTARRHARRSRQASGALVRGLS